MDESKDRTLWIGNLTDDATDELLYELFLQAGPLERVSIPKDKATGKQKNFAFVTFKHELSVPFCINIFDGVYLHNRRLNIKTRNGSVHTSGKNPVDPDKWGIGLLPHPSKGCGIIKPKNFPSNNKLNSRNGHSSDSPGPSDQDNNNGDEYDHRRVVVGNPGLLMPPPGPPMMGIPSPQAMPANSLGYQGQTGQRNFQRSQTWPGIVELPENDTNSDGRDSRSIKHKYEERFNDRDTREVSRDSRDSKRRRFEESPRNREDGRRVVRDDDRRSRNGGYDRQRSFDRGDAPVESQLQQMAQLQMQMLQQQQMQGMHGRGYGGSSSRQHSSGGGYRRY